LEAVFILWEFPSPSRRIFIGSHSLPPLWFAVSVLHFFPAVFALLDGDGFILQMNGVFTRIRSGATLAALGGGAFRSTAAAACADLFEMATAAMGGKP
jgi:hypothetical protein